MAMHQKNHYPGGVKINLKCLAVDSDRNIADAHVSEWAERGVRMERADNMTEAIQMLLSNDYIFVGINGDAIDFMPLLSTMRSVTNAPILIVTGSFTTEREIAALQNGADLYARWHESPIDNVSSVLAHIARITTRNEVADKVLFYKNLLISSSQRYAFIGNTPLDLTRQEYDLLHYLLINQGNTVTYGQIYHSVWNEEHDDSHNEVIKALIKRLRRKLAVCDHNQIIIENVWGIGYRLPLNV